MSKLALRFISGKYKGGEYVLAENKEIFIGRSSGIELVLMEDMVSRKHARLMLIDGELSIEDLGSTNGTFVNGEKISKTTISKGDRVLVGTSIMKVVEAGELKNGKPAGAVETMSGADGSPMTSTHMSRSMSGTITEVPLPDLIQLFSTSKKSGTLVVSRTRTRGHIHLRDGAIIFASIDDLNQLPPLKALFRILSWTEGTFDLVGPEDTTFDEEISLPTEHILMEGLRQIDEFRHNMQKLPPADGELAVNSPLENRLADLSENELDIFQGVLDQQKIQTILDTAGGSDSEIAAVLLELVKKKYLTKI